MQYPHHTKNQESGFTLVELMVVASIFAVISSIVLFQNARFNNVVILENLAYDVALSVREAQVYGLSVRQDLGSGSFDFAYGIHVGASAPSNYVLFIDANENDRFDAPAETLQTFTLRKGFVIGRYCADNGGTPKCSDTSADEMEGLSVVYRRPDPEGLIRTDTGVSYSRAEIVLQAPNGNERSVVIYTSGQISVE